MSKLLEYAKRELDRIPKDADGMQEMINKDILEIVAIFSEQEHSGFSASYAISKIKRLLCWNEVSHGSCQNKRCSSVFKNEDGTYHDIDAIVVSDNGGITWFTSGKFRKNIEFPYCPPDEPERVYIEYTEDVPAGFSGDKYEIITDKPERIKALYERKRKEFDDIQENKK